MPLAKLLRVQPVSTRLPKMFRRWFPPRLAERLAMTTPTLFLVDGTQVAHIPDWKKLLESLLLKQAAIQLYESEDESLRALGPWLCHPDKEDASNIHALFVQHPGYYVSAIRLREGASWQELARQWQKHFNRIDCISSNESYYLRYADVRVLELLPRVMNAHQWHTFTSSIEAWIYVNRALSAKTLIPARQEIPTSGHQLQWTEEQLVFLIDLCWPDALLAQVYELRPHHNQRGQHAAQHAIATQVYQRALTSGHGNDSPYQVQACLKELNQLSQSAKQS